MRSRSGSRGRSKSGSRSGSMSWSRSGSGSRSRSRRGGGGARGECTGVVGLVRGIEEARGKAERERQHENAPWKARTPDLEVSSLTL